MILVNLCVFGRVSGSVRLVSYQEFALCLPTVVCVEEGKVKEKKLTNDASQNWETLWNVFRIVLNTLKHWQKLWNLPDIKLIIKDNEQHPNGISFTHFETWHESAPKLLIFTNSSFLTNWITLIFKINWICGVKALNSLYDMMI